MTLNVLKELILFNGVMYAKVICDNSAEIHQQKKRWPPRIQAAVPIRVLILTNLTINSLATVYHAADGVSMSIMCTAQVVVGSDPEHHSYITCPHLARILFSAHAMSYGTCFLISVAIFCSKHRAFFHKHYYDKWCTMCDSIAYGGPSVPKGALPLGSLFHYIQSFEL